PAFLLFAIGLIILSQAQFQGYFILIAGIFVGFGYGTFMSSAQAIAIKESPKHRIGLATSTYYIFLDVGIGIGPFLVGIIVSAIGFLRLYIIMAVVVLASSGLYYFLHGRKASLAKQLAEVS